MLHGHENLLQIAHLSQACVEELTPSFDALPHTKHADGDYRLRRYSVVTLNGDKVVEEDQHTFVQTSDINHFQGDVVRRFEPLELNTLNSKGLLEMCQIFSEANELEDGHPIEIHQMRIDAIYDETPVAPEGVHQDGFDAIALVGIHRHNIVGGEVMLYEDSHQHLSLGRYLMMVRLRFLMIMTFGTTPNLSIVSIQSKRGTWMCLC